jgi:predicted AAA+ superfamily ATPase
MTVLALRSGQMLNQSDVNRDANIPQPTVHRYINILEAAYLLEKVPIYAVNRTKRLIKTPKIYFNDPGLASFLMGYHSKEDLGTAKEKGAAFETLVFHLLKVWASLKTPSANIFYWRTVSGHEVDFVIELGRKLVAVEVKSSSNVKYSDAANIKLFMKEYPQTKGAVIVYTGREIKRIGENIYCVPWDML